MTLQGEIKYEDIKDMDTFVGYEISPIFRHYGDYEGDFNIYFDTLENAQKALADIENVFTIRKKEDNEFFSWNIKKNEDFVRFRIYKWSDGSGEYVDGTETEEMVIEVY